MTYRGAAAIFTLLAIALAPSATLARKTGNCSPGWKAFSESYNAISVARAALLVEPGSVAEADLLRQLEKGIISIIGEKAPLIPLETLLKELKDAKGEGKIMRMYSYSEGTGTQYANEFAMTDELAKSFVDKESDFEGGKVPLLYRKHDIVQIMRPPEIPVYGNSFNEYFNFLSKAGIPVIIDPYLEQAEGMLGHSRLFSEKTSVFFVLGATPLSRTRVVYRHEELHTRQFLTEVDAFLERAGVPPAAFHQAMEKAVRGEPLNKKEKARFERGLKYLIAFAETEASGNTIRALFSLDELKKTFGSGRPGLEAIANLAELGNVAKRNFQLAYFYSRIYGPRPWVAVPLAKGTGATAVLLAPPLAALYSLYRLFDDDERKQKEPEDRKAKRINRARTAEALGVF